MYAHVKEVLGKSGRREALEINYMQCALVCVSSQVSIKMSSQFVYLLHMRSCARCLLKTWLCVPACTSAEECIQVYTA